MKLTPYHAAVGSISAAVGCLGLANLEWVQSLVVSPSPLVTTGTIVALGSVAAGAVTAAWNRSFNTFGRFAAAASIAMLAPHLVVDRTAVAPQEGVPALTRSDIPAYTAKLAESFSREMESRRAEVAGYQATIADLRERLIMVEANVRKELEPGLLAERQELAKNRSELEEHRTAMLSERAVLEGKLAAAATALDKASIALKGAEEKIIAARRDADSRIAAVELRTSMEIKRVTDAGTSEIAAMRARLQEEVTAQASAAVASLAKSEDALEKTAAAAVTQIGAAVQKHEVAMVAHADAVSKIPAATATAIGKHVTTMAEAGDKAVSAADRASRASATAVETFAAVPTMLTSFQNASTKMSVDMPARVAAEVERSIGAGVKDLSTSFNDAKKTIGTEVSNSISRGIAEVSTKLDGAIAQSKSGQQKLEGDLASVTARVDGFVGTTGKAVATMLSRVESINLTAETLQAAFGAELSRELAAVNSKQDTIANRMTALELSSKAVATANSESTASMQDLVRETGVLNERVTTMAVRTDGLAKETAMLRDDYSTHTNGMRAVLVASATTNAALEQKIMTFTTQHQASAEAIVASASDIRNMANQVGLIEAGVRSIPRNAPTIGQVKALEASVKEANRKAADAGVGVTNVKANLAETETRLKSGLDTNTADLKTHFDTVVRNIVTVRPAKESQQPVPQPPMMRVTAAPASISVAAQQAWIAPPLKVPSCAKLSASAKDGWDVAVAVAYPGYIMDSIDMDGGFVWATAPNGQTTALPMMEISRLSGCKVSQTASR